MTFAASQDKPPCTLKWVAWISLFLRDYSSLSIYMNLYDNSELRDGTPWRVPPNTWLFGRRFQAPKRWNIVKPFCPSFSILPAMKKCEKVKSVWRKMTFPTIEFPFSFVAVSLASLLTVFHCHGLQHLQLQVVLRNADIIKHSSSNLSFGTSWRPFGFQPHVLEVKIN